MSSGNRLLGNTEYKKKNYEKALEYYNMAIENNEDDSYIIYSNISSIYRNLEDRKNALENIKKSIQINPNWEKSWFKLGELLTDNLKYEKAIESYKRAIELNPDNKNNNIIIKRINRLEECIENTDSESSESECKPSYPNTQENTNQMFDHMLKNDVIKEKMLDPDFQKKILANKSNPFVIFQDTEIMGVMKEMYKEFRKNK
jgi:tetratricopeptide (TPR) repeat protein